MVHAFSVACYLYIFFWWVFSGPQNRDVEHISSTLLSCASVKYLRYNNYNINFNKNKTL